MKKQFDNLRPFEKRVAVGVAAMFFVVMNFWFVFPHFSDLSKLHRRMATAQSKMGTYQTMLDKKAMYEKLISTCFPGSRVEVSREDEPNQFSRAILMQAGQSGVAVTWAGAMQLKRETSE